MKLLRQRRKNETEERVKIINEFYRKLLLEKPKDNPEEKKKREAIFNEKKREYEEDGERCTL